MPPAPPQYETMCYIGMKPCGCIAAIILDKGDYKKTIGETLKLWVNDGLKVGRVTVEFVQANFVGDDCPHEMRQERLIP